MSHVVNYGLLFSFITLAVSGVMSFLRPFSQVTTRIHIVFGLLTLILVGCHLAARLPYFKRTLQSTPRQRGGRLRILGVGLVWLALLAVAVTGWAPAESLIRLGYEARKHAIIVRESPLTGIAEGAAALTIAREPSPEADIGISLTVRLNEQLEDLPALAVWAESSSGALIETLYLSGSLAYTDTPDWNGRPTPRHHILPIWRHRYTLLSGVDPNGAVDAVSGATNSHQFTLDSYLVTGEDKSFVLCVEVNAPADPNDAYPDPHLGQPSLLYTAYIKADPESRYVLLELTGHGGGAETGGAIQYDLETCTTAQEIIDLLLVRIDL